MEIATRLPRWSLGLLRFAPARTATGPARQRRRGPVFIHDALTPWGNETLLLALLRGQAEEAGDDPAG